MKRFVKISAWTLGVFVFLIGMAVGIAYLYEDEIKAYAVDQLNTYLESEVFIDDIDFSLLQRFPSASVEFTEVVVNGTHILQETDTLLYASSIIMEFNIWDLWDENYTVREMEVAEGELNVFVDASGLDNFHIFKTDQDSIEDQFEFELEVIELNQTDVQYVSLANETVMEFRADHVALNGNFSESQFDLQHDAVVHMDELTISEVTYLKNRAVGMGVNLHVNYDTQEYLINHGQIAIEQMVFDVGGQVAGMQDHNLCELYITSDRLDLQALASILPQEARTKLLEYDSEGILAFDGSIIGPIGPDHSPNIQADFNIDGGSMTESTTSISLENIHLTGNYTNQFEGRQEALVIQECTAELKGKPVTLAMSIENFKDPHLALEANGALELKDLQQFAQIDRIEYVEGDARFSIEFKGDLKDMDAFSTRFDNVVMAGDMQASGATLKLKDSKLDYAFDQASGNFYDNVLSISADGMVGDSKVGCDGAIQNVLNHIFFGEALTIDAKLRADKVHLPDFMEENDTRAASDENGNVHYNLALHADEVSYGKFTATDLNTIIQLENGILIADGVSFRSAGGEVSGNMEIDLRQAPYTMASNATFNHIEVDQVFYQFNNFSQQFVTDKNLKGTANAQISFLGQLDADYRVMDETVESVADLEVINGELIGQKTLLEVSDYIRDNAITKVLLGSHADDFEQRMKEIKFEKLSNQITVSDGTVHIPDMDIDSDALDIELSGDHTFENAIDYQFNFRYRDLKTKKESEFGPIKDDGTGIRIFLAMRGTTDDPIFEIDKDSRKEERQEKLEEEKNTLKSILHEEFGLFKNDTTLRSAPVEADDAPTFIIDWEEYEEEEEQIEESTEDNRSGFDRFLNNLGIQTEEEEELLDDDDF